MARRRSAKPCRYATDTDFKPFIAVFDDGTPDALLAKRWMDQVHTVLDPSLTKPAFVGELAIITNQLNWDNTNTIPNA